MLRITVPIHEDVPLFILEGRLAGEWVQELIRVTRHISPGTTCVFDIEDVSYVDLLGEETLLWLNRLGAAFIADNAYGRDLCHRLHLHRTTATRPDSSSDPRKQESGKAPRGSPIPPPKPPRSP